VKTGGLADVVGALRERLRRTASRKDARSRYPTVMRSWKAARSCIATVACLGRSHAVGQSGEGHPISLSWMHRIFMRGPATPISARMERDWPDTPPVFCRARLRRRRCLSGGRARFLPDVLHVHDWQAALAPAYLKYGKSPARPSQSSPYTIWHFRGRFSGGDPSTGSTFRPRPMRSTASSTMAGVGYLKGGLQCADAITTVSPTYAPRFARRRAAWASDGLLRVRRACLNGNRQRPSTTDRLDPATDTNIAATYDGD